MLGNMSNMTRQLLRQANRKLTDKLKLVIVVLLDCPGIIVIKTKFDHKSHNVRCRQMELLWGV